MTCRRTCDLGGKLDRYVALEDHLFAVHDRHVGQWQLEDDCKGRRTEPNYVVMSTSSWTISLAASPERPHRTGRHRLFAVYSLVKPPRSGILKFLSSKRLLMLSVSHCPSDLCQHSMFGRGKSRFSTKCHPGSG